MRLERELVALLRLLADREQAHLGPFDVEDLVGEDRAHVRELEQVLRPRVRVRAGVEQDGRPLLRRDRHGDRGPHHAGDPAQVEEAGGEHRARVPGRDDRVGAPFRKRDVCGDERGVGLGAHRLGGLLVHLDRLGRLDELEPARVEAGRAEERDVDPVGRCFERACDDLVWGAIPA